ncbi:hypothetical protein GS399_20500 [Pedobacter sp. HMF7647]|uniref:Uncharacterized protein n=1 Tax=Hufsiella arboris TaxID=2695275 RepID=A0A7K1YFG0_9SPHI|nr:hypothetical protein [Hufsiella arboris]MXV53347.1 hypothetical protein [Hufsiella arboris]
MKQSLLIIFGLLTSAYAFSQQKCDSTNLQVDKIQLQSFWTAFKNAINQKDKVKLASLVRFPFTCDYCILDTNRQKNQLYIKVTRATFDRSQYQIFFADRLVKEANKHNLPQDFFIFQPHFNTVDKKCTYSFQYIARDENAQHPGMQHWFDIQKVNGQFKIVSAWTLP